MGEGTKSLLAILVSSRPEHQDDDGGARDKCENHDNYSANYGAIQLGARGV